MSRAPHIERVSRTHALSRSRRGDAHAVIALGGPHLGGVTRLLMRLFEAPRRGVCVLRPDAVVVGGDVLANLLAMHALVRAGRSVIADFGPALPLACADGSAERRFTGLPTSLPGFARGVVEEGGHGYFGLLPLVTHLAYAVRREARRRGKTALILRDSRLLQESGHRRGESGCQLWLWEAVTGAERTTADGPYRRARDIAMAEVGTIEAEQYEEAAVIAPSTLVTSPMPDLVEAQVRGQCLRAGAGRWPSDVSLARADLRATRDRDFDSLADACAVLLAGSENCDNKEAASPVSGAVTSYA